MAEPSRPSRRPRDSGRWQNGSADRGSASIWVLCAAVLTGVVASTAVAVAQTEVAVHRAAAAADLAALAAADAALLGPAEACARAAAIAVGSGAELVSCAVADGVSDVDTRAALPVILQRFGTTTARARAGPPQAAVAGLGGG